MWLSDTSIKQPVFITMVVVAILVVGVLFFGNMGLDLLPDVSIPVVAVQTVYPGASPEEVESEVTKPLEEALGSLNRVSGIRSTSTDSVSMIVIDFDMEYSSKTAAEDVRERLASVRSSLPSDVLEPVVSRFDPAASPILSFAIADKNGKLSPSQLRTLAKNTIQPRIERVPGVAAVTIAGGLEREVHVDLDSDRLRAHNLPVQQVVGAISSENLNLPGGRLSDGGREDLLRTTGEFASLDEIGLVQIPTPLGGSVFLRDLANISLGNKDQRTISRVDGVDSVVASVQKQSGTNTVQVADAIKRELRAIEADNPDLRLIVAADQSVFTRDATNDLLFNLVIGALLAAVIVFLFFRDLRNTLVTVAGLPVILLGAFAAMHVLGLSINMITLMALALSIGMLIDDAIVVRENIFRHMERGEHPREAASKGTAEITLAVLATTFSIVAVFGPIAFTTGIAGKFLREFGLTVVLAVLISLFEAFTLAPMLSAYFFKQKAPATEGPNRSRWDGLYRGLERGYRVALGWALNHRLVVVLVGLVAFAGSAGLLPMLGRSFIPTFDEGEAVINLELQPGATLAQTDQVARQVEELLLKQPEVDHIFTQVGTDEGAAEKATIHVNLKQRGQTTAMVERVRPQIAAIPNISFNIDQQVGATLGLSGGTMDSIRGRPIQINVQGQDFSALDRASQQVMEVVRAVPGAVDVGRSLKPGKPEVSVRVNRARAADLGVSAAQIASTVRTLINGEKASRFRAPDEDLDIVVRLQESDRQSLDDVLRLPITTGRGGQVPLSAVATVQRGSAPAQIEREDRQRQIVVGAGYLGRPLGEVTNDVSNALSRLQLPPGVSVSFGGQTAYMQDMLVALTIAILLAVVFLYMVLASQFGSFVQPFIIMVSLPLSFVGAFAALLLAGKSLDMVAMIGLVLLMGLVTKNSILLIDFINRMRRQGSLRSDAILTAGPIRLRPILMTTLAMIFGMVPVAFGLGAGSELRVPMGVAVIGGLITSTILTLVVVPVVYTLVDDLVGRLQPAQEAAARAHPRVGALARPPKLSPSLATNKPAERVDE